MGGNVSTGSILWQIRSLEKVCRPIGGLFSSAVSTPLNILGLEMLHNFLGLDILRKPIFWGLKKWNESFASFVIVVRPNQWLFLQDNLHSLRLVQEGCESLAHTKEWQNSCRELGTVLYDMWLTLFLMAYGTGTIPSNFLSIITLR